LQTFKDNRPDGKAATWTIELNYDAMRRVQADTRLDLTMPFRGVATGDSPINLINQSIIVLLDVLWSICRLQADGYRIKRAFFETYIEGEPLEEARQKLMEELSSFFRRNRREADADFVDEMSDVALKIQTITKANLGEPSSDSVTNSPESSE
jgi:hypothetical protein